MVRRIISGGQTGADRAALDAARTHGIETGGWVPAGRWAEDGTVPDWYRGLEEAPDARPATRTRLNVRDSDATLIVSHGPLCGGSALTADTARALGKPWLHLDFDTLSTSSATDRLRRWLAHTHPTTLNVAGPRASEDSVIYGALRALLDSHFADSTKIRSDA